MTARVSCSGHVGEEYIDSSWQDIKQLLIYQMCRFGKRVLDSKSGEIPGYRNKPKTWILIACGRNWTVPAVVVSRQYAIENASRHLILRDLQNLFALCCRSYLLVKSTFQFLGDRACQLREASPAVERSCRIPSECHSRVLCDNKHCKVSKASSGPSPPGRCLWQSAWRLRSDQEPWIDQNKHVLYAMHRQKQSLCGDFKDVRSIYAISENLLQISQQVHILVLKT